ncbi:hypothetical protein [Nocardia sp. NPDC057668]|uniref:hypothetical protein n=1 Tax=Nocardia sp. NPDC057668 TaxID=3346202 RepID=UPI003670655F
MSRSLSDIGTALCLAIEPTGAGFHPGAVHEHPLVLAETWIELSTARPLDPATVRRVRTTDLLGTKRRTARMRAQAVAEGDDPTAAIVLVDLEVIIAEDVSSARRALERLDALVETPPSPTTLRYIGTPAGLAGLISDIHAAQVADGVVLLPLANAGILALIASTTLPVLAAAGASTDARPLTVLLESLIEHPDGEIPAH